MKIHSNPIEVTTNAAFVKSVEMGVSPKKIQHVLSLLTNIYTDPEIAVVRETVSNAIDSHRAAGQTKPVEVTFPNYLNPSFIVKDYGVGMSEQELTEIYSQYGESTKDDDDNMLGAFGLGAKSPLALSSSFTVNSVKDGTRNIVVISKSEDGKTRMNFLAAQETDEPNGVTVTVPVAKPREFERVEKSPVFLGFHPGTLLVNGKEPSSIHNSDAYKTLDKYGWYEFGNKVTDRGYRPVLRVMLDTVPYGIATENAEELLADFQDIAPLNTIMQRLVLAMPNSSVEVTPSRDNLIYNDFTKKALKKVLKKAVPLMLEHAARLIADAPDRKASVLAADSLHQQGLLATGNIAWQGEVFAKFTAGRRGEYKHIYATAEMEREVKDAERLHFAKVQHGYNGALRISREYGHNIKGHFAQTRRFVIVTEATRKPNGDFDSDTRLKGWYLASGIKSGGHYDYLSIYTTTRKAADLPVYLTAMAETVVTAADVIKVAKANATPRKRGPRDTTFTITYTQKARDKSNMLDTVLPEELDENKKYVIAQATGTGADGEMTYENSIYAFFRAVNSGKVIGGTEALLKAMTERGYSFIIIPASADRQKYIDVLPNVHNIDEAIASVFTFEATPVEQGYFAHAVGNTRSYRYNGGFDTRALYKAGLIEQVKNEDTREYLNLHRRGNETATRLDTLAQFWYYQRNHAATLKTTGPATKALIEKIETAAKAASRLYPLISDGIPDGAEQDAIDYINLIDNRNHSN